MPKITDFSAVIFDLDGLVLDTESTFFIAWRQAAEALGFTVTEPFCHSLSGLHGNDLRARLSDRFGNDFDFLTFSQQAKYFWHCHVRNHGIAVRPGFEELLAFVKNRYIPYCLATNSRKADALTCLTLAGLKNTFDMIISRDDVDQGKPEPDIFCAAAALLKVPIHRCLVLEDSGAGIKAARQAGAISLLIPSTPITDPVVLQLTDAVFKSLTDVLTAINRAD